MHGEGLWDQFGNAVASSFDGNIVAIGAKNNDAETEYNNGHVRVFEWVGSGWKQRGSDINGEALQDRLGHAVSLSADGNILASSARDNDGNGVSSGHVRVYLFNGSDWVQVGEDIEGENAGDLFGESVSLSSDGSKLAVGAIDNDAGGSNAGNVRVFTWDGSAWTQLGQSIVGESAGDESGSAVSLSSDGLLLAIGSPGNSGGGSGRGHVRVYAWTGTEWEQRGSDIDGENNSSASGSSVSLSSDGSTLAIGATSNTNFNGDASGHVRVLEWSGDEWLRKGCDLDGEGAGDLFGASVSLSGDGNILVVGGMNNDGVASNAGEARIYMWAESLWKQYDMDLNGDVANAKFGSAVAVSGDGSTVVIGARGNALGGTTVYRSACEDIFTSNYRPFTSAVDAERRSELNSFTLGVLVLVDEMLIDLRSAENILSALLASGIDASAIDSFESGDMASGLLNDYHTFLVPELSVASLYGALSSSDTAALQHFAANGGTVIVLGANSHNTGWDVEFINGVFNLNVAHYGSGRECEVLPTASSARLTAAAAVKGAPFALAPEALPWKKSVYCLDPTTLPADSTVLHSYGSTSWATRMLQGSLVHLGYSWFKTPLSAEWNDLLKIAIASSDVPRSSTLTSDGSITASSAQIRASASPPSSEPVRRQTHRPSVLTPAATPTDSTSTPTIDAPYPIIKFSIKSYVMVTGVVDSSLSATDQTAVTDALSAVFDRAQADVHCSFLSNSVSRIDPATGRYSMRVEVQLFFTTMEFCSVADAFRSYSEELAAAFNDNNENTGTGNTADASFDWLLHRHLNNHPGASALHAAKASKVFSFQAPDSEYTATTATACFKSAAASASTAVPSRSPTHSSAVSQSSVGTESTAHSSDPEHSGEGIETHYWVLALLAVGTCFVLLSVAFVVMRNMQSRRGDRGASLKDDSVGKPSERLIGAGAGAGASTSTVDLRLPLPLPSQVPCAPDSARSLGSGGGMHLTPHTSSRRSTPRNSHRSTSTRSSPAGSPARAGAKGGIASTRAPVGSGAGIGVAAAAIDPQAVPDALAGDLGSEDRYMMVQQNRSFDWELASSLSDPDEAASAPAVLSGLQAGVAGALEFGLDYGAELDQVYYEAHAPAFNWNDTDAQQYLDEEQ